MTQPLVYLCGTITPDPIHNEWRKVAERELADYDIGVLSPVRGKDPADWSKDGMGGKNVPYDNGGYLARDRRDVERCDVLLLVMLKGMLPVRQSIGTWCEWGWATILGKPAVAVTDVPEVANHPFIYRQAAKVCHTLDDGIAYVEFLLS